MKPLTKKQAEVYEYILSHVEEHGRQPTFREIGAHFGTNYTNGVMCHIKALDQKGWIERLDTGFKGWKLVGVRFVRVTWCTQDTSEGERQ